MADYTLGSAQLSTHLKIIPISVLVIAFDDDTYRLELVERDSTLSVRGIGEENDRGGQTMTAVEITGQAVIPHNAYASDELRVLMRRLMREPARVTEVTVEATALTGQEAGADMHVRARVEGGVPTVKTISLDPWSVVWIPTERGRLEIPFRVICSIDVLEDWDDGGTDKSHLFHQEDGF